MSSTGHAVYRGSTDDVLSRMMLAVNDRAQCDVVLRITGDDIMIDPEYLKITVDHHLARNADYTDAKDLPSGTEVEVFNADVLSLLSEYSIDTAGTEYLTNYITGNGSQFKIEHAPVKEEHQLPCRLTIDTREDFQLVESILTHFKNQNKTYSYNLDDIKQYFMQFPEHLEVNKSVRQRKIPHKFATKISWKDLASRPRVSVYITNYNYGRYIEKAIHSVLEQTYCNFEIIIIDDGSTDDSRAIINRYSSHPRIKVIFQENLGLNATNNIALHAARGEFIVRLDADDYFHPNALELMVSELDRNPRAALVFPDYYEVTESGEILAQHIRHDFKKDVSLHDQPAHGACTLARVDVLRNEGGYGEEFSCQDGFDIWLKVIKRHDVSNISLPLFSLTDSMEVI